MQLWVEVHGGFGNQLFQWAAGQIERDAPGQDRPGICAAVGGP